jgi:hypothetical protein
MTMSRALLIALTLASMAIVAWPAGRAAAAIDITGNWSLALQHPDDTDTLTCSVSITQNSANLAAPMTCDQLGFGTLTGTIDDSIGTFNLSGSLSANPVSFAGISEDGATMSGFWVVSPVPGNGTFSGIRGSGGGGVGGVAELADVSAAHAAASGEVRNSLLIVAATGAAILCGLSLLYRRRV